MSTVGAGTINLDAQGAVSDVVINDGVQSAGGSITITADNDIILAADGDVSSTSGAIAMTADWDNASTGSSGALTMANGALINAGSGTISLQSDEDLTLGSVQTTNAGSAVTINSKSGGLLDAGDTAVDIIANSGSVQIDTKTGVGVANGIETSIGTLDLDNATSGLIDINETDTITVANLVQGANAGVDLLAGGNVLINGSGVSLNGVTANATADITIWSTAGSIDVQAAVSNANLDGNASIVLNADGGASDINVAATISADAGPVSLLADDSITFQSSGNLTATGTGAVTLTADANANSTGQDTGELINLINGSFVNAGSGLINVSAPGNVSISNLTTTSSSTSAVTVTTSAAVTDSGDGLIDVDAANGTLVIDAETGVNGLETTVGTLDIDNTTSGNVQINESGNVSIAHITNVPGNITLTTSGAIVDDVADNAADFTANTLTVSSPSAFGENGGNGSLDLNVTTANITGVSGDLIASFVGTGGVAITANTDAAGTIRFNSASEPLTLASVSSNDGPIDVSTINQNILATTVTAGGLNNISLTTATGGNILIGSLDATGDQAIIDSAGSIDESTSTDVAVDIVATTIDMDAVTGIGGVRNLQLEGTSISADTTGGAIDLDNTATATTTVSSLTTGTGNIRFDQSGIGNVNFVTVSTVNGAITLTSGNSSLDAGSVTAGGSNNITLSTGAGDITMDDLAASRDSVLLSAT
ncbi:MAG: hypothetical protein HUJ31_06425, partial [Pseudomonadales bacterium]|nr:hypothetical protein [Pseudomonadales bacterium]